MKANEAPKKIYLLPRQGSDYAPYWKTDSQDGFGIEYTRTDAFVEMACDAYCAVCDTKECQGCGECSWVIKFRRQLLKY